MGHTNVVCDYIYASFQAFAEAIFERLVVYRQYMLQLLSTAQSQGSHCVRSCKKHSCTAPTLILVSNDVCSDSSFETLARLMQNSIPVPDTRSANHTQSLLKSASDIYDGMWIYHVFDYHD